jgi:YegS/Rv2252/BmrU family lipid kinase
MDTCVIFNPAAARGRARRRLESLQQILGDETEFRATERPGQAEDLALDAAKSGFAFVAAAGGDGTLHEVANGVLRAGKSEVALAVFPLGSANDYAYSLGLSFEDALKHWHDRRTRQVDVGWVRSGSGRERYFINTLGLGFSASVTFESRKIRRLRGLLLYSTGFLRALRRHFACPKMRINLDCRCREGPTFSLTLAIGRREGNFLLAPRAVLDDGLFEHLHVGAVARWEVLRFMPRIVLGKELPRDHRAIWMGQCREAHISCELPITSHLDGELFTLPEDGVTALGVQVLPGMLRVLA